MSENTTLDLLLQLHQTDETSLQQLQNSYPLPSPPIAKTPHYLCVYCTICAYRPRRRGRQRPREPIILIFFLFYHPWRKWRWIGRRGRGFQLACSHFGFPQPAFFHAKSIPEKPPLSMKSSNKSQSNHAHPNPHTLLKLTSFSFPPSCPRLLSPPSLP